MLKVGLKYCGGCRARYDRVGLVDSIRERLGGAVQFVSYENPEAQAFLIVTGCRSACAHVTIEDGRPVYIISSPADAEVWITSMLKS